MSVEVHPSTQGVFPVVDNGSSDAVRRASNHRNCGSRAPGVSAKMCKVTAVTSSLSYRTEDESDDVSRRQLSQPRIAEMIADNLRRRILAGELNDGDVLPKVDDLLLEFPVSKPSIREAMRILETEGLVSVRRGNVGGAVIHTPKAKVAAYMFGMVLQAQDTLLADLAATLSDVEPACTAKAAERSVNDSLVATLNRLNEELEAALNDEPRVHPPRPPVSRCRGPGVRERHHGPRDGVARDAVVEP